MKQPTAPDLYPELPIEDGQNYRLQKITEIEQTLINERDKRKSLYKKCKRGVNVTDGVDTSLISTSVVLAGIGIAFPILLPIQIAAVVCGSLGGLVKLIRRKLTTKSKKHYEIKTMAECKLNSIKDLISKSLTDGQISADEFKSVLDELEKYNKMKENIRTKQTQTVMNDNERKKLIEDTEARVKKIPLQEISTQQEGQELLEIASNEETHVKEIETSFIEQGTSFINKETQTYMTKREMDGIISAMTSVKEEIANELAKLNETNKDLAKRNAKIKNKLKKTMMNFK
ncbi:Hypothetical predicted protein [Mytilus galloprovincialis]|uniref:Uncharacterized protein n=1 Tax=Mytilus galloprovincialis TaxID=29158 RepID=A0A8B6HPX8_MYTGA|nr:Hypothetical predicted protein [Mytilus galloprovincialis]